MGRTRPKLQGGLTFLPPGFCTRRRAPGAGAGDSPHDGAAVTPLVGARVAATWGRGRVTGMDVHGAQLTPAQHGQEVLVPRGGRAAGGLVGRGSITPPVGPSAGRRAENGRAGCWVRASATTRRQRGARPGRAVGLSWAEPAPPLVPGPRGPPPAPSTGGLALRPPRKYFLAPKLVSELIPNA